MVVEERLGEGGLMSEGLHMGEGWVCGCGTPAGGLKKKSKGKKGKKKKRKGKKKKLMLRIQLTKRRVRKYQCTREHLVPRALHVRYALKFDDPLRPQEGKIDACLAVGVIV